MLDELYKHGELRACDRQWENISFCMKAKISRDPEKLQVLEILHQNYLSLILSRMLLIKSITRGRFQKEQVELIMFGSIAKLLRQNSPSSSRSTIKTTLSLQKLQMVQIIEIEK